MHTADQAKNCYVGFCNEEWNTHELLSISPVGLYLPHTLLYIKPVYISFRCLLSSRCTTWGQSMKNHSPHIHCCKLNLTCNAQCLQIFITCMVHEDLQHTPWPITTRTHTHCSLERPKRHHHWSTYTALDFALLPTGKSPRYAGSLVLLDLDRQGLAAVNMVWEVKQEPISSSGCMVTGMVVCPMCLMNYTVRQREEGKNREVEHNTY